jgi:hypothetical protein
VFELASTYVTTGYYYFVYLPHCATGFNLVVEVRYCFSLAPILDFDSAFFASASFNSCCNFLAGIQIGLFLL